MGALRRAAFVALLVSSNGCRCNSVDEKELPPSPSAAATPSAPTPKAAASMLTSEECGPEIGGVESIASAPAVILGELHGLASAPAFAGDLSCRLAFSNPSQTVTLALEIPGDEQSRLDAFLASEGRSTDRTALTSGAFWKGMRDGRSSIARLEMLERIRQLNHRNANIRVRAIDVSTANRDEGMAKNVLALVAEKRGPVLVLVGNLHARTKPGGDQKWMGEVIRSALPNAVSLDNRYGTGEAWICTPECGRKPVKALDTETDNKWRIDLKPEPDDKGYNGVWRIGTARASDPAVP